MFLSQFIQAILLRINVREFCARYHTTGLILARIKPITTLYWLMKIFLSLFETKWTKILWICRLDELSKRPGNFLCPVVLFFLRTEPKMLQRKSDGKPFGVWYGCSKVSDIKEFNHRHFWQRLSEQGFRRRWKTSPDLFKGTIKRVEGGAE